MNYENGGSHINYATVTVSVKDGVTITAPEDDRMKKQVTEVLACAYTVSNAYTAEK